ncbi:MAG: MFS transporter [Burkholderiaceae bacterium]
MSKQSQGYLSVLIFGCLILVVSFGARSSFALFMPEMTVARDWSRELFSFSFAVQNLLWGVAGPFVGAYADKFGVRRVLVVGGLLYALGFFGMAYAESGTMLVFSAGLVMGLAVACTAFGVVFSVLGKVVPEERRSLAFGVGTASGSFGQFLFLPLSGVLIDNVGWHLTLLILGCIAAAIMLFGLAIRGDKPAPAAAAQTSIKEAFGTAMRDKSFHFLFWGYFVCGLQVVFIGLHLPTYLQDQGMSANIGATAIAIIGLFNIVGSIGAGVLGQRVSKKGLLSCIYVARSVVMVAFLTLPLTPVSVYLFSAAMGLLWLSTVPTTTALVGQIYGVRYLGMLAGIIFFGHQIGSFLGAWLGGRIFDTTGSYDMAWGLVIVFGLFAAVMHMPIDQRPLASRNEPVPA